MPAKQGSVIGKHDFGPTDATSRDAVLRDTRGSSRGEERKKKRKGKLARIVRKKIGAVENPIPKKEICTDLQQPKKIRGEKRGAPRLAGGGKKGRGRDWSGSLPVGEEEDPDKRARKPLQRRPVRADFATLETGNPESL